MGLYTTLLNRAVLGLFFKLLQFLYPMYLKKRLYYKKDLKRKEDVVKADKKFPFSNIFFLISLHVFFFSASSRFLLHYAKKKKESGNHEISWLH